ncbi:MAG: Wzz/FepE/Etk N-terminal domain-containing protein [Dehalococcoidia bacterium]|nr:Wzz/FepE/Etk N-terminal domain-containing protein [Dehalococcoidia bacterium]
MDSRPRLGYLAPLIQWWWVVLLTVIAAEGAVLYTLHTMPPSYQTMEKLQIVAPGPQDVALFGQTRTQVNRDEILFVQNNFTEIIKSDTIAQRVVKDMGIPVHPSDITENLKVVPVPSTDVVYVYLNWPDPEIAPRVLAAQVLFAQEYFAKARAKQASGARQFITQQLMLAKTQLDQANNAFVKFKIDHRIAYMDQEIRSLQDSSSALSLERDKVLARGEALVAGAMDLTLAKRSSQMRDLIATSAEYNDLDAAVKRADDSYNFLLGKENEAILKENEALNVDFIQLLEDARSPAVLVPARTREIAALGAVGGVMLGALLALALGPKKERLFSKEEAMAEGINRGALEVHVKTPAR